MLRRDETDTTPRQKEEIANLLPHVRAKYDKGEIKDWEEWQTEKSDQLPVPVGTVIVRVTLGSTWEEKIPALQVLRYTLIYAITPRGKLEEPKPEDLYKTKKGNRRCRIKKLPLKD